MLVLIWKCSANISRSLNCHLLLLNLGLALAGIAVLNKLGYVVFLLLWRLEEGDFMLLGR